MPSMVVRTPGRWGLTVAGALLLAAAIVVLVGPSPRQPPSSAIHVLALSHDGRWLAGGGRRGKVQVHDLETAQRFAVDVEGNLNDLQFSPDGTLLAAAARNITLVRLSGSSGIQQPETRLLRTDEANYGSIRFGADGASLLTVTGRGAIQLVPLDTGMPALLHCCTSIWGDAEYSADRKRVVWAGHWPGVLDLSSRVLLGRLTATRQFQTFGPILNAEPALVYMGSQDGRVYEWNLETRQQTRRSPAQSDYVRTMAFVGASGWIAYAAEGGVMQLWQPSTGAHRTVPRARPTSNLVFDARQNLALFGTSSGQIESWSLPEGLLVKSTSLLD